MKMKSENERSGKAGLAWSFTRIGVGGERPTSIFIAVLGMPQGTSTQRALSYLRTHTKPAGQGPRPRLSHFPGLKPLHWVQPKRPFWPRPHNTAPGLVSVSEALEPSKEALQVNTDLVILSPYSECP